MIELLTLLLLVGAIGWAVGACMAWLLATKFAACLQPAQRIRDVMAVACLPWLLPVLWVIALGAVAVGKRLGWLDDHCAGHGHLHFCLDHFPALQMSPWPLILLGLGALILVMLVIRRAWRGAQESARLNALLRLLPEGGVLRQIDNDYPVALVARPLRPVILISRGMLNLLNHSERRVLLAHEAQHLRCGDLRHALLLELLLTLHLPQTASALRSTWRQAIEERADDRVAERFGHALTAQTLLKVAKQQHFAAAPMGLAASGADVVRRIERLLQDTDLSTDPGRLRAFWLAALSLASAMPLAAAHHAVETALAMIVGA